MNITLSLFRTKGLTRHEVGELTEQLENSVENLQAIVRKTQGDIDFWRNQLKKQTPDKKCIKCGGMIAIWPFNTSEAYYIKGNRVQHVDCATDKGIE